jgi:hypothetical protein
LWQVIVAPLGPITALVLILISGRATLSNINMSTVKSEICTPATDVSCFKPNKERDDIVTSLEEWAAQLLKPDTKDILKVEK